MRDYAVASGVYSSQRRNDSTESAGEPAFTGRLELHQLLAAAALNDGIDLAWGRVFFLYGPHEASARLVPSVVIPLLQGKLALMGDGLAQRDFMHVQDVATALVTILDSQHRGAVNIATGHCTPIRDVVMTIAAQIGQQDLVRLGARLTPPEEPRLLAASGHVLAQLGFRPHFSLQTGLADAIDWWRNQLASGQTQHQSTVRKFEQKTALFTSTSADDCQRLT